MCSFGVASWARISSARIPPAPKKTRLVAMYRIPIRLWSVVVSHDVTRPRRQSTAVGGASTLMATAGSLRLLEVADHRGDLRRGPVDPDGRHVAERGRPAGAEELGDVGGLEGAALQRRAVRAL